VKLLFDQNISYKIITKLSTHFPDSIHVRESKMQESTNREIWEFAKTNSFTIVTYDSDFSNLVSILGHPPKVIWIKSGNNSTDFLTSLLIKYVDIIKGFISGKEYESIGCLELLNIKIL
jgi:predicted nuclease of predicted toxin-antitoxin system